MAPARRGGWGGDLITAAVDWAFRRRGLQAVHAYILPDNAASLRAFGRAGFNQVGEAIIKGKRALRTICSADRARETADAAA